ncbi:AAA family ATPase [Actinosynnema sp. NPDC023794]
MLNLRHLQIRIKTTGPECGTDIRFTDGLNVIRADNSSGKSTTLQSIVYALGLEGMLSAKRDVPLPHAMTDSIEINGHEYGVLESWVSLEVSNARSDTITVKRFVKSSVKDRTLIEVTHGAALSSPADKRTAQDFFVRRPGAAQRDLGFHRYLENFLGWSLPRVTKVDGAEVPLYLECLFPYFFVEQKHGWSGLQARIPTYFGIRDVNRRAAEYVLALDEYAQIQRRQRLEAAATIMDSEWRQLAGRIAGTAQAASIVVQQIPSRPVTDSREVVGETLIATGSGWSTVSAEINRLEQLIEELRPDDVRPVGDVAEALDAELSATQTTLIATNALLNDQARAVKETQDRFSSVSLRVEALEEDLQRHKDANLLRQLGSTNLLIAGDDSFCPTCQQNLPDGFEITTNPMSPEVSVAYIEQELRTFRAMAADFSRLVDIEQGKLSRLRVESADLRRQIRSLKDALTSPSSTPSVSQLMEQARLIEKRDLLSRTEDEISQAVENLRDRAEQWRDNRRMLKEISDSPQSGSDARKLQYLRSALVEQLHLYHFDSLDPDSIEISHDTFRPTHEGFDLGFDLSASDMIRMIWSYLLAFLEVGMNFETNHARLLIFDEPRQQDTRRLSFAALLRRAAVDGTKGAQIIFATSEEEDSLREMLDSLPHRLISQPPGTKLLRPVN